MSQHQTITLIDASPDSLTVSWTAAENASSSTRYVLQYRKANRTSNDTADAGSDAAFTTLSDTLASTQARKKNLTDEDGTGFFFRVATKQASDEEEDNTSATEWITHAKSFVLMPPASYKNQMAAPTVSHAGAYLAARVAWKAFEKDSAATTSGYELQMRENLGGAAWTTIAANVTSGTEVKKKNLVSLKNGYQFRVRPTITVSEDNPFSPPSGAFVALGLSEPMKQLFTRFLDEGALLRHYNQPPVQLEDALGGKEFILFYASAHWCGPCRQFTPQLANWYQSLGSNKTIEVVFLSADHDENGFKSYYSTMPWTAIPFDDDGREAFMSHIRVSGIPRLAVMDARTGRIIEDNAVGKPLDITRWRKLSASSS